jgi:hypothetical protein
MTQDRSRAGQGRLVALSVLLAAALAVGGYALSRQSGSRVATGTPRTAARTEPLRPPGVVTAAITAAITEASTATATATGAAPAGSESAPSADGLPTDGGAPASSCPSAADAEISAFIIVGALALEQAQDAQDCVYPGTVDPATTASLSGRAFQKPADDHSDTGASGTFTFTEVGGHGKLKVTTTKEADGKYYVTAATLG